MNSRTRLPFGSGRGWGLPRRRWSDHVSRLHPYPSRQTDRQTDRLTDKQTDTQTDTIQGTVIFAVHTCQWSLPQAHPLIQKGGSLVSCISSLLPDSGCSTQIIFGNLYDVTLSMRNQHSKEDNIHTRAVEAPARSSFLHCYFACLSSFPIEPIVHVMFMFERHN